VEIERHHAPEAVRGEPVDDAGPRIGRVPRVQVSSHAAAPSAEIQWLVLFGEISKERPVVDRVCGGAAAKVSCAGLLALAVDFRVEPGLKPAELAAAKVVVQTGQVLAGLGHELGGVEVAERVRREVAKAAEAPVDVLQATLRVVGRRQSKGPLKL